MFGEFLTYFLRLFLATDSRYDAASHNAVS